MLKDCYGLHTCIKRSCLILIPENVDINVFLEQTKWDFLSDKNGFEITIISYDWSDEGSSRYYEELFRKIRDSDEKNTQIYLIGYEKGASFAASEAAAHTGRYSGLIMLGGSEPAAYSKEGRGEEWLQGADPDVETESLSVWIISPGKTPEVEETLNDWCSVNSIPLNWHNRYRVTFADELYLPPTSRAGKITSDSNRMGIVLFSRSEDYYTEPLTESIIRNFILQTEKDHASFSGNISGGELRPIEDTHFTYHRFQMEGQQRDYWMFLPDSVSTQEKPATLILCLHGNLETGEDMIVRSQWHKTAAEHNCIVLYPSCLYKTGIRHIWQILPEETRFMRTLVERVISLYPVDRSRIYVTGFSNGSGMVQNLIIRCADLFAAAVLGAPAYYEREIYGPLQDIHEAAALYSYGTEDEALMRNDLTPDLFDTPAVNRMRHWGKLYGFTQDSYELTQTADASIYTYRSLNNIPVCHWIIVKGKHHDYTAEEVPLYYEFLNHFTRGPEGELYYDGIKVISRHTQGLTWDEYTENM